MSFKYNDIKDKDSEKLKNMLLEHINDKGGNVSINFLADEIRRKENKEFNIIMGRYTKWIVIMTALMLLTTIINLITIFV